MAVELPSGSEFPETVTIVSREEWGAQRPVADAPFQRLPTFVRFVVTGNEKVCEDRESCIIELKEIQQKHFTQGYPDINYNFLVANDGTIYEGRGWKTDIELEDEYRDVQGTCLDIAYMGSCRLTNNGPPWEPMLSAFNLLLHGVNNKLLSPFFDFHHLVQK